MSVLAYSLTSQSRTAHTEMFDRFTYFLGSPHQKHETTPPCFEFIFGVRQLTSTISVRVALAGA